MRQFERGTALLRSCYQTLQQAEQKIELLAGFDADGKPILEPFDATATHDPERQNAGRRTDPRSAEKAAQRASGRPAAVPEPEPDRDPLDEGPTLF